MLVEGFDGGLFRPRDRGVSAVQARSFPPSVGSTVDAIKAKGPYRHRCQGSAWGGRVPVLNAVAELLFRRRIDLSSRGRKGRRRIPREEEAIRVRMSVRPQV